MRITVDNGFNISEFHVPENLETRMILFMDDLLRSINHQRSFDFAIDSFYKLSKAVREGEGK